MPMPRAHILENEVHLGCAERVVHAVVLGQRREAEVGQDRCVAQVDRGSGRRLAVLALIVELGHVDQAVRQMDIEQAEQVLVEHPDIEGDPVADERPIADELQQLRQHLPHRTGVRHVLLAQVMHLDGARLHRGARPDNGLECLAGEDPRAANLYSGDADDIIGQDVKSAGFAVEGYDFTGLVPLEQEGIALIGEQEPIDLAPHPAEHAHSHGNRPR